MFSVYKNLINSTATDMTPIPVDKRVGNTEDQLSKKKGTDNKGESVPTDPKRGPESKFWIFVFNNYDLAVDPQLLINYFITSAKKYRFQEEVGETGTPHLQGAVQFNSAKGLKTLKSKLHIGIHWEIMQS